MRTPDQQDISDMNLTPWNLRGKLQVLVTPSSCKILHEEQHLMRCNDRPSSEFDEDILVGTAKG